MFMMDGVGVTALHGRRVNLGGTAVRRARFVGNGLARHKAALGRHAVRSSAYGRRDSGDDKEQEASLSSEVKEAEAEESEVPTSNWVSGTAVWLDPTKVGPMANLGNSVIELVRLGVLLPMRYLVVVPALWIVMRVKEALKPPVVLLRELKKSDDVDMVELIRVLKLANSKGHAGAVVDFFEEEVLFRGDEARLPVSADVVKEYLVALVKTGRIESYGDDTIVSMSGQNYASLPLLLRDLMEVAEGDNHRRERKPGDLASWPLHISVQGGLVSRTGQGTTLQSLFWFFSSLAIVAIMWMVGAVTARRVVGRTGQEAQPGIATSLEPKEFARENMPQKSIKTFADVKGCDEAISELKELVEYLKKPEKFVKLGGTLPKGVLLTGPPGTGKTLLARAVAGEANVPFFYKSGSEFDEMFVGVGSRRVRSLFAAAKKKSPCIIFIDEIDAIGGTRSNYEASGGSRKTLNQLLTEMDGFEENSGVVVIGATNLPDMLDAALTRPGRFDRHVTVALPDVQGRKSVLDLYLSNKPVEKGVDSDLLARRTPGFSGADLFNMVNEAALMAATQDLDRISEECLDEARDKILMGSPRALSQSTEARRLTAYHEGGHALVALYTPGAKPIHKATIVPRGHALGMVSQVPDKDEYSTTKQQMMAHIDVCMGGKVAEEIIFGPEFVTSGATSDLKSATRMARHMVEDCGMSEKIGPVALSPPEKRGNAINKDADEEVSKFLHAAYERVGLLLRSKEQELHKLADALLEHETLTQQEIKNIVSGADFGEVALGDGETLSCP
jgi:ATP-dependent metalloprotease